MRSASEKCNYLEELSCKEDSLEENWFCFTQNQDTLQSEHKLILETLRLSRLFAKRSEKREEKKKKRKKSVLQR